MSEFDGLEIGNGDKYNLNLLNYICSLFFTKGVRSISDKKFDKEYSTQFMKEVEFLREQGIRYEFVKETNGVCTYKYKKTLELFKALVRFYEMIYYK